MIRLSDDLPELLIGSSEDEYSGEEDKKQTYHDRSRRDGRSTGPLYHQLVAIRTAHRKRLPDIPCSKDKESVKPPATLESKEDLTPFPQLSPAGTESNKPAVATVTDSKTDVSANPFQGSKGGWRPKKNTEDSFSSKKEAEKCSICYQELVTRMKASCGHIFCESCWFRGRLDKCPLCREEWPRHLYVAIDPPGRYQLGMDVQCTSSNAESLARLAQQQEQLLIEAMYRCIFEALYTRATVGKFSLSLRPDHVKVLGSLVSPLLQIFKSKHYEVMADPRFKGGVRIHFPPPKDPPKDSVKTSV